jgi:hypothetical protein
MKRLIAAFFAAALCAGVLATPAGAAGFGLKDLDATFTAEDGPPAMNAGGHPFAFTTTIDSTTTTDPVHGEIPLGAIRDLFIELPEGTVADRGAVAQCPSVVFLESVHSGGVQCPDDTAVGFIVAGVGVENPTLFKVPVFNMTPPRGTVVKFGFVPGGVPVTLEAGLSQERPYKPVAKLENVPQPINFYSSETTIWGNPSSSAHDAERGFCLEHGGLCHVNTPERAFLTMPRSCSGPLQTDIETDSWQEPGVWLRYITETHDNSTPPSPLGLSGCGDLGFTSQIQAQPTSDRVESPTGLDVELSTQDPGLTNPDGIAHSDIQKAVVTLPEGVTANPSLAEGLGVCSQAQLEAEKVESEPGEGCPQASKVGTVEVESPILENETVEGELFIATPYENPFSSLLALYMVVRDPQLGILVKLPGKVEPDPHTGQLITTFGEAPYEIPQVPLSDVRVHLREGGRSPLITPPSCGTYTTTASVTPWARPDEPLTTTSSFDISRGLGGGACPPAGAPPFAPGFSAGTLNNAAGSYSPFHLQLTRRDGDQDLTRFSSTLPPGVTGKLAGIGRCSDAAIAVAKTKTGKAELASPSCPADSRIGSATGGAGVGSELTYVTGSLYLAGPYNGAPASVVAIVPAVAGPFDVGNVVVRQALRVDSRTAVVSVDGSASDPLPHILAGIPLRVRDIRADVDRPEFTLNPTSCNPFEVGAQIWGGGSNPFSTLDDSPVSVSDRFQAAGCAALGFKPAMQLTLKGGTRRGSFPALHLLFKPRSGDANLSRLALRFPHSEFIEQGHFRTICTRVQFAAGAGFGTECPKGSVYGHVRIYTPILDEPLVGPVYLRSSNHNLPDVVLAVQGPPSLPIHFEVPTRIDSVHGGLRAIAEDTPDVPVGKVLLNMLGGQRGLFVNSMNICAAKHRADLQLAAQNGAVLHVHPLLNATGCKKHRRAHKRHHHVG